MRKLKIKFLKSNFWTIFIPEFDLDLDKVKKIVSNSNSLKVIGEEMKIKFLKKVFLDQIHP